MNVRVDVLFDSPGENARNDLWGLGRTLADDPTAVRVFAPDGKPGWLSVEFTMPTEPQLAAVDKIDRVMRFAVLERLDSVISFPKSAAERERARRKNERRKARRRAKKSIPN